MDEALGAIYGIICALSLLQTFIEPRRHAPHHRHDHTGRNTPWLIIYAVTAVLSGLMSIDFLLNKGESLIYLIQ